MPFTFAHPAIVVCLNKSKLKLSLTALIIGSMIPDFEYFLKMKVDKNVGHHLSGIFIFDFPVALIFCYLFHNLIRNGLINNLPNWFKQRFYNLLNFDWNKFAYNNKINIIISLLIGILSHIAWDGFTHFDGYFVRHFEVLNKLFAFANFKIPIYSLLQALSSIIGLIGMYYFLKSKPLLQKIIPHKIFLYWFTLLLLSSIIFTIRFFAMPNFRTFFDIIMAGFGSILYALIIISVLNRAMQL